MSGEAERARAVRLEQQAEEAVCPGCEHDDHGDGPCDAWWIVPGTADVEVSCGCHGPTEEDLDPDLMATILGPPQPARLTAVPDPWAVQGPVPPPPF